MTPRKRRERRGDGKAAAPKQRPAADDFADALAVANERRELADEYGDAFSLAGQPPHPPPPAEARPHPVRGDALDEALALTAPEAPDPRPRHHPSETPTPPTPREPSANPALRWADARRIAARAARPLPSVTLPLPSAEGHILAEPLHALADLPPFDTSAMDGYAVAGPGPWRLDTGGGILAGHAEHPPLPDGHAVRIATGARVPPGATGVLRTEHGELRDDGTLLAVTRAPGRRDPAPRDPAPRDPAPRDPAPRDPAPRTGQDIRPRGQECRSGAALLPAGERVTPAVLGLAAAAGHDELTVVQRPRVEVLVLGAELQHRGLPRAGRIRDALGPMLAPWLRAAGAEPFVTRRLGDDAELLYEAVATTTADVVVTTGGTAAGPVDHVHGTLRRLGAELLVDGVAVRPGHPMLLAALPSGGYVVGLPGNPLAAVSGLLTLAEPLVHALGGTAAPEPSVPDGPALTEPVTGHPDDTRLVPVALVAGAAPGPAARPLHFTGPAMLRGLATAHALAVIPPGGAAAGDAVRLLRLPWAEGRAGVKS